MIKPTVGRIVIFRAKLLPDSHPKESPEQAAIVTKVHDDRRVNLTVFGHEGGFFTFKDATLVQPGDEAPADRAYCEWMPYQKGQAARAEQLEKQIAGL